MSLRLSFKFSEAYQQGAHAMAMIVCLGAKD